MKSNKGTSKNLLRSEILNPSSETRKMSGKSGGVARGYVDGFSAKSDEVAAEEAKLQPKEVFRGALNGKVFIVGAGPGNEELITLAALNAISTSDVILYDELANDELLKFASKNAILIYVGKKAGCHALLQGEIEKLLLEHAKAGKIVCRLKGGDPFIFGRGGEEMKILAENKIPYELVPGISSAIAAPAYAGIPVTQRNFTSGVAIFTGHEDPTKNESDLNWKVIANLNTTLVFLMGMKNLPFITQNLMGNGMDKNTPAAVVHRGTTPLQKTVIGTLENISSLAEKEKIGAPSVIVIGKTVELREKLAWFEKKPLFGKRIMVTRSRKQASVFSKKLRSAGAFVREFATIEIIPSESSYSKLEAAIKRISDFEWIIFTSANGAEIFFERLFAVGLDARHIGKTKICAIGPATASELSRYGIKADLVPKEYIAESIYESLKGKIAKKKILIPRSALARKELVELLQYGGALVEEIAVYDTKMPAIKGGELKAILSDTDIVTFTSSSTAENFARILGSEHSKLPANLIFASIGPITTAAAEKAGLKIACEAREYTIDGLVKAITEHAKGFKK